MLITLYGPDSYRRIAKLNEIIGEYRKKYTGMSYERFDLSQPESFVRLTDFISTKSMFDPVRLVVLDNILESGAQKEIKDILKSNADAQDVTIIINFGKALPATYKFLLKKSAQKQEFLALKNENLYAFIRKIAYDYGVKLDTKTIRTLGNTYSGDVWSIVTELERMSFSKDQGVVLEPGESYFTLVNKLKYGRSTKERVVALERLLSERHEDPSRVFNNMAYRLSGNKEARRFADYDISIKSGGLEYEEVLFSLAIDL